MEDKFEVLKDCDGMWMPLGQYLIPNHKDIRYNGFQLPEAIMYFVEGEQFYKITDLEFYIFSQERGYLSGVKQDDLLYLEASLKGDNKRIRLEMCYAAKIVKDEK
jgi:hypothetical protein